MGQQQWRRNRITLACVHCGAPYERIPFQVKKNRTRYCSKKCFDAARLTYDKRFTVENAIWRSAKARCFNPKNHNFANYGGRGITMSTEWAENFGAFIRDMGPRPSPQHSIDRINNDGNYERDNCRWATPLEQARNKRPRKPRERDAISGRFI